MDRIFPWAWEDLGESPLWIEFTPGTPSAEGIRRQLKEVKGKGFLKEHRFAADYEAWLIPIPLKAGAPQDEVVDEALQFIFHLKQPLERATGISATKRPERRNS